MKTIFYMYFWVIKVFFFFLSLSLIFLKNLQILINLFNGATFSIL